MMYNDKMVLDKMAEKGLVFSDASALISDEAMVTTPNVSVPGIFTTYVDPTIVEILTAPTNAREIFAEVKKGDWTTQGALFKSVEYTGDVQFYNDFNNGSMADVNVNFPYRENALFQTFIRYGDQETAVSSKALIDLAGQKQRAAANIINIETNKYYLYGVSGKEIYGLLNEPNIPAAITPAGEAGSITWDTKTTTQIYEDILALASELFTNSQGRINANSELVLAVSPTASVCLGKATDFNISVRKMLADYFTNLKIVNLPELHSSTTGDDVMLIARSVEGAPVAQLGYSDKMRAMRLIAKSSYYEQKYIFSSYGAIIYRPYTIARMTGVLA